jgi:preprotein translocase subunit YajC
MPVVAALAVPILALQEAVPAAPAGPGGPATPAEPGGATMWLPQILMFGAIGLIFWFLIIRPQSKAEKERRAMLEAIQKKDRVVTSGGLLGTVADLRDDEITLRISESPDVKVRVRRTSVVEVLRQGAETAAK